MHFSSVLLLLLQLRAAIADCNNDNCLRALVASAFPTRHGAADCSSYLEITVTPATATITSTITTTVYTATTDPPIGGPPRRQVKDRAANVIDARQATVAPTIPTYASACSGAIHYSSACSCLGVTATTTTLATPSTTVTVQATVSAVFDDPGVLINNYADESCTTPYADSPQLTVYADGTCYPVIDSDSNLNIQFNGGTCGFTADQCTLNLYSDESCVGNLLQSFPASNTACFDSFYVYGAILACPAC